MNWCRLWHDLPNDPKWRTIAKVSKQPVASVISVYIHLMVQGSTNATERGRTQPNAEDLASALDLKTEQVEEILAAMQGRVLCENELSGWRKRQPNREDGGADRAKKWRENKKNQQVIEKQPNAGERNRTQQNAPEEIRLDKRREVLTHTEVLENTTSYSAAPNGNPPASARLGYLADESFAPFMVAACEYWTDLIEEDLQKSWLFTWKKFDFEQKADVVKRLHARIEAGEPSNFVSRPPKYLEDGSWKRPPRPKPQNGRSVGSDPLKSTYPALPVYKPGEDS